MANYFDGLRKMFSGAGFRGQQIQQQEQAAMNGQPVPAPTIQNAPVQPQLTPEQVEELQRQEQQRRLQLELEAIRNRTY